MALLLTMAAYTRILAMLLTIRAAYTRKLETLLTMAAYIHIYWSCC